MGGTQNGKNKEFNQNKLYSGYCFNLIIFCAELTLSLLKGTAFIGEIAYSNKAVLFYRIVYMFQNIINNMQLGGE